MRRTHRNEPNDKECPFLFFILCMIIAIPCLLCGESDTLHIKSYSMRKYIGVVVENGIFSKAGDLGAGFYYKGVCYYKYDNDKICSINEFNRMKYSRHSNAFDDDGITYEASITEINMRCPINSTRTVYYDIRNGDCSIINSYVDIANTGVTFMIFGFFALNIYIAEHLNEKRRQRTINTNTITQQNNPPKILFEILALENEQECSICLEKNKIDWVKTVCGHDFHKKCIIKNLKCSNLCPLCKQDILKYDTQNLIKPVENANTTNYAIVPTENIDV